jgi:adenylate kinase
MKIGGKIYIFIGPPGSGKGTLAQECVRNLKWATLSTGALCRQHISQQTEIGKQIDLIIKSGKLISDELVTSMVDEWLASQINNAKGIILDGYPRTEQQVSMLFELLRTKYAGVQLRVVKFDISDKSVIRRLSSRLMCQNKSCQAVYSILPEAGLAPKQQNICDRCSSALMQRADDMPEVIQDRLIVYHQHDPSAIFERMGQKVEIIGADRPFTEIFDDFKYLIKCEQK